MLAAVQSQGRQPTSDARAAGQRLTSVPDTADTWDAARCRDGDAGLLALFFSDVIEDIATAKTICAQCPLVAACLEGALARQEPWGVWGGQLFADGRVLAFKRRRGRPRKSQSAGPGTEDKLTA